MNMDFLRKLPIPKDIKEMYPLSSSDVTFKTQRDEEIKLIFEGKINKKVLVIGPCSADNGDAVLEYLSKLKAISEKVYDKLVIIPRVYTHKPRTNGDGYKGMLHQPDPNSKPDMLNGLISARQLHIKAISETGFTCADEMLYPDDFRYFSDLLSYATVGARSCENQQHRLTASGLDIPVGMKNPTGGDISVMLNSIYAAEQSHTFIYRGWEVVSHGNPLAHAVLRGYVDKHGVSHPNYHYDDIYAVYNVYISRELKNPSVLVDTNHCNSNKNYLEQPSIAKDVLNSMKRSRDLYSFVKGFMIESYINDGAQEIGENRYGTSITDPCLGLEKTEKLIYEIAESL